MKKIWKVKNNKSYSDIELIDAIKKGTVKSDDLIICDSLDDYVKVDDSIYRFYIKENNNENI